MARKGRAMLMAAQDMVEISWQDEETASLGAITSGRVSHFVNVGSCGHVIAQCSCPDAERERFEMMWPCIACQNRGVREETNAELHPSPGYLLKLLQWWREGKW